MATAQERAAAQAARKKKADEARAAAAAEAEVAAQPIVETVPTPVPALTILEEEKEEEEDPDAPLTDDEGNIVSYADGKMFVTSPDGTLISTRDATIAELEQFDPAAIEIANRKNGEKEPASEEEEDEEEKENVADLPVLEERHPFLYSVRTPDPEERVSIKAQREKVEAMRATMTGMGIDPAAIEAGLIAMFGKLTALGDVEAFTEAVPASQRIVALYHTLKPALDDINRHGTVMASEYNRNNADKTPIRWSNGSFVTAFEAQAQAQAAGTLQPATQRRRRSTGSASTTADNNNGTAAVGLPDRPYPLMTHPAEHWMYRYQKEVQKFVQPVCKMQYDGQTFYFALMLDGATDVVYKLADWNQGSVTVVVGQRAQTFTSLSSAAKWTQGGRSINGWAAAVQWPDRSSPSLWLNRNAVDYERKVFEWAASQNL